LENIDSVWQTGFSPKHSTEPSRNKLALWIAIKRSF
jgi:hypothetical protein